MRFSRFILDILTAAYVLGCERVALKHPLNLQPKQGKAKAYQIKQIRNVILKYHLGGQDED
jgi:hypothetical protein